MNGGAHYAFTVPEHVDIPNAVKKWPGVDIRSAGKGYIASGRGYKNAKGEPIDDIAINRITQGPELDPMSLCKRPDKRIKDPNISQTSTPLVDIKYCLDHIETDEKWLNVGMSVHQASNGSEEAWELFDEWSAQFPGSYDYDNNRKRWESFRLDKPGAATMGTLLHFAGLSTHDLPSQNIRASDDDLADEVEAQSKVTLPMSFGFEGFDKKTSFLIKGVLPSNSTSAIYGPSGSYKSFLAISWACHIATGKKWDSRRTEEGSVMYIVGEGGSGVPRRIKAWAKAYNNGENVNHLCCINMPVFMADSNQVEQLNLAAKLVEQKTGLPVVMIVVDTLARCFGGHDENKASDMGAFIAGCDTVKAKTGATVLIVHHSGKQEEKGARGSSSFRAALDAEYLVKRESANAKALTLKCTKQKDAEETECRAYELHEHFLYTDDDGEEVNSLALFDAGRDPIEEELAQAGALSVNHRAMYRAICTLWDDDGRANWSDIIAKMKTDETWNSKKGKEWRDKLENEGLIIVTDEVITKPDNEE